MRHGIGKHLTLVRAHHVPDRLTGANRECRRRGHASKHLSQEGVPDERFRRPDRVSFRLIVLLAQFRPIEPRLTTTAGKVLAEAISETAGRHVRQDHHCPDPGQQRGRKLHGLLRTRQLAGIQPGEDEDRFESLRKFQAVDQSLDIVTTTQIFRISRGGGRPGITVRTEGLDQFIDDHRWDNGVLQRSQHRRLRADQHPNAYLDKLLFGRDLDLHAFAQVISEGRHIGCSAAPGNVLVVVQPIEPHDRRDPGDLVRLWIDPFGVIGQETLVLRQEIAGSCRAPDIAQYPGPTQCHDGLELLLHWVRRIGPHHQHRRVDRPHAAPPHMVVLRSLSQDPAHISIIRNAR